MKIFIDTNILLELFKLSGPDLDELKKVLKLSEKQKIEILISSQIEDEFWRNRENVIADAMKNLKETKIVSKLPNIARGYETYKNLKNTIDTFNKLSKQLEDEVQADISENKLKADELIKNLFESNKPQSIDSTILSKAQYRMSIGNPPGKKGSLGDAINWEWLLTQKTEFWENELILISADGDFESELNKGKIKEYLIREWKQKNPDCEIVLFKSLPDFLDKYFPQIKFSDEIDKIHAIESLADSYNFASTHSAIYKLNEFSDFNNDDVIKILNAYKENSQVRWILSDPDVIDFAKKIVTYAKSNQLKTHAEWLKNKINELESPIQPNTADNLEPFF
jgi:predicted nucleic acid-binding protein